jgi:hypothetical protein
MITLFDLPIEIILMISKQLRCNSDILALGNLFPTVRFTLPFQTTMEEYKKYKYQFNISKIWKFTNADSFEDLPLQLVSLRFHDRFNSPLPNTFPKSLTTIIFGSYFNHPINNLLRTGLKKLFLGNKFNFPIDRLPETLELLCFGERYLHKLPEILPNNLKHLKVGKDFNHVLPKLPDSLTWLSFHCFYTHRLHSLPRDIKTIYSYSRHDRHYTGIKEMDYLKDLNPNIKIIYTKPLYVF